MIVRHRTPWMIGVTIALLVLLASISSSTSMKLRKPRKRPTPTIPHQQSRVGPVIIRVIHKYNDELARGKSPNCTGGICKNAHNKLDLDEALSEQDNFLPDQESLRYIVYPKKYEHFVSKKNTGHGSRYRRYVALPEPIDLSNASDHAVLDRDGNVSKALRSENKAKLKKVTLLKAPKRVWIKEPSKSLSEPSRTRRSLDGNFSRRNASDYAAQRRAVMERYYARQREINSRYANRTSNATLFRLGLEQPNRNWTTRNGTVFRPPVRINPIYNESRTISSVQRNTLDHYVTPTPCTNISLSGTFAPKTLRHVKDCSSENNDDSDEIDESNEEGSQVWGTCKGKLVYQHNLLLGLTGPSNLESLFEVFIDDSICITCVKAVPYNNTRATVSIDSGGRGNDYVRLKLKGYKNKGFSYIIKIWAVGKINNYCNM
ncbi:hypothetical protein DMN91_007892 [Ooceraea biroi]|uniref:Uncharacterized protein n=1 Tax=Ooceraea biroi TaxID=2015173 RepID=A0A3L8DFU9_OOCBI|nr:uncharacterized protein LOC105280747 [Ooceraea biroi]RLU19335.1 hypothetical protein DMN91_007892 [Ooceraea biroi]